MDIGWAIVIFGLLYVLNTFAGIGLTYIRDRLLQTYRFEAEREQAEIMAKQEIKAGMDVKVTR